MIQYDKDGMTVFYIDGKGSRVSADPMAGGRYSDLLVILDAQHAAVLESSNALIAYNNSLGAAQGAWDLGQGTKASPVLPKPVQHLVDDYGKSTYVPFAPPLKDLVIPVPNSPSSGLIAAPSVDKEGIMYAMITAIYRKMFPTG